MNADDKICEKALQEAMIDDNGGLLLLKELGSNDLEENMQSYIQSIQEGNHY